MSSTSSSVFYSTQNTTVNSTMDMDLAAPDLQEYATQYFGFTPKSFTNGIYNAVIDYMGQGVRAMEEYLIHEFSEVMTASQIQEGSQNILSHLATKVDKSFDTLEAYLANNVFSIPPHVVLPEDQPEADCRYSTIDEKKLDAEIEQLKNKIMAIKYANSQLQEEMKTIDTVKTKFDSFLSQLREMDKITLDSGVSDPKDTLVHTATSVIEQVNMIQSLQGVQPPPNNKMPGAK